MLSETECSSMNEAIRALDQALNFLLSLHRVGSDVQTCVVGVTEALEKLEDLLPEETAKPSC
jgi:hypothetical protein